MEQKYLSFDRRLRLLLKTVAKGPGGAQAAAGSQDFVVITAAIGFAYYFCLTRAEVLGLKISDVLDKAGNVESELVIGRIKRAKGKSRPFYYTSNLPIGRVESFLIKRYVGYMNGQGYSVGSSSRLVQLKKGVTSEPYGPRTFERDIKDFSTLYLGGPIKMTQVREIGICRHFFIDLPTSTGAATSSAATYKYAGIGNHQLDLILKDKKKIASRRRKFTGVSWMPTLPSDLKSLLKLPFDVNIYFRVRDLYLEPMKPVTESTLKEAQRLKERLFKALDNSPRLQDPYGMRVRRLFKHDILNLMKLTGVWFDQDGEPYMK